MPIKISHSSQKKFKGSKFKNQGMQKHINVSLRLAPQKSPEKAFMMCR